IGDSFNNSYTFGFMSPWQKNILNSPYFCLDATHKTINIDRCLLYTIIVRYSLTGTGCLVAFCFTKNHSARPITESLSFVKSQGHVDTQKITIDVSSVELSAIQAVYPEAQIQ
ncbi:hypothetical protein BCV72DRAFT_206738, partial [Rhizopus microsporus var. microsporus]